MNDPTQQIAIEPAVGVTYIDDHGRELEVTNVQPGDQLGREVIGLLSHAPKNGHRPAYYSTDLKIFAATWRLA